MTDAPQRMPTLAIPVRAITLTLAGGVVAVLLLALISPFFRFGLGHDYVKGLLPFAEQEFDLNGESNLPTWYSSALLLICGLVLLGTGLIERAREGRDVRYWLGLAAIFTYMSLDETAMLHERLGMLREVFGLGGILYFGWVVVAAPLVLLVGVTYLGFLRRLPARTRNLFLLAGGVFVGGALGLELIQGYLAEAWGAAYPLSPARFALTYTEEVMEMGACVILVHAVLDYVRAHVGFVRAGLTGGPADAATRLRAAPAGVRPPAAPVPHADGRAPAPGWSRGDRERHRDGDGVRSTERGHMV